MGRITSFTVYSQTVHLMLMNIFGPTFFLCHCGSLIRVLDRKGQVLVVRRRRARVAGAGIVGTSSVRPLGSLRRSPDSVSSHSRRQGRGRPLGSRRMFQSWLTMGGRDKIVLLFSKNISFWEGTKTGVSSSVFLLDVSGRLSLIVLCSLMFLDRVWKNRFQWG